MQQPSSESFHVQFPFIYLTPSISLKLHDYICRYTIIRWSIQITHFNKYLFILFLILLCISRSCYFILSTFKRSVGGGTTNILKSGSYLVLVPRKHETTVINKQTSAVSFQEYSMRSCSVKPGIVYCLVLDRSYQAGHDKHKHLWYLLSLGSHPSGKAFGLKSEDENLTAPHYQKMKF